MTHFFNKVHFFLRCFVRCSTCSSHLPWCKEGDVVLSKVSPHHTCLSRAKSSKHIFLFSSYIFVDTLIASSLSRHIVCERSCITVRSSWCSSHGFHRQVKQVPLDVLIVGALFYFEFVWVSQILKTTCSKVVCAFSSVRSIVATWFLLVLSTMSASSSSTVQSEFFPKSDLSFGVLFTCM